MWHVKYNPRMGEWRVYDENWYYVAGYKTHVEAMAYADSQARTVCVTLPKVVERKRLENKHIEDLIIHTFPSYTNIVNDWGDMEMNLRHEELKPLAEYLLALHYEKEQQ